MEFEWDEAKRAANLEKHGIDFQVATTIWKRSVLDPAEVRAFHKEYRFIALGCIGPDEMIIAVVYTLRDGKRRLISARRARRNERTDYKGAFGRGR